MGARSKFLYKLAVCQVDPLSIFSKACLVGALSSPRLTPSQLRVSLYADGAALFISPTAAEIEVSKQILLTFGAASGLMADVDKSVFMPIACEVVMRSTSPPYYRISLSQLVSSLASASVCPCTESSKVDVWPAQDR